MSIVVKDLVKKFGETIAVNNLNFEAPKGTITGFLGPNGAGKSTTMKIICGFLNADSGSVEINGIDLFTNSLSCREKIGYLPENNPLYPDLYIPEYLKSMAKPYRINNLDNRVRYLINKVGLSDHQYKKIGMLSKGLKQRVGLARTLLHDPEVLILDEPTTGLDPNQLVEIRNLIVELGTEKTIILSTHIMQEVQAICQNAVVISKGTVVGNLNVKELGTQKSKTQIEMEFANNIDSNYFSNIPGVSHVDKISETYFHITAENERATKIAIFNLATQHNNPILKMTTIQSNIEDVFQDLTK